MKIVIFGCDNSGKSTLGRQLAELTGGKYIHSPGVVPIEEMKAYMEDNLNSDETVIFDRFPIIEEYVYGPLFRGENKFKDDNYNKSILSRVDLFIFCYPGLFATLDWKDRDQYPGVKENVLELLKQYNLAAYKLKAAGYNVKEYDYRFQEYRELI